MGHERVRAGNEKRKRRRMKDTCVQPPAVCVCLSSSSGSRLKTMGNPQWDWGKYRSPSPCQRETPHSRSLTERKRECGTEMNWSQTEAWKEPVPLLSQAGRMCWGQLIYNEDKGLNWLMLHKIWVFPVFLQIKVHLQRQFLSSGIFTISLMPEFWVHCSAQEAFGRESGNH